MYFGRREFPQFKKRRILFRTKPVSSTNFFPRIIPVTEELGLIALSINEGVEISHPLPSTCSVNRIYIFPCYFFVIRIIEQNPFHLHEFVNIYIQILFFFHSSKP